MRYGRVYDGFTSPVKIWCSAPLITSGFTPGSQNVAEYLQIISLNLTRMSGFTCPYFSVSSPKASNIFCETLENLDQKLPRVWVAARYLNLCHFHDIHGME